LLIIRGALTTFSLANDLAKYFAIVPALFASTLPWLKRFDVMGLHSATSAILSAVIFNALIIPLLIPVALKGSRISLPAPTPCCGATCSSGAWAGWSRRPSASG
jgi:K+-transporting ATPase ATPase B chain